MPPIKSPGCVDNGDDDGDDSDDDTTINLVPDDNDDDDDDDDDGDDDDDDDQAHNKMISDFQALRQARAPVAGIEPSTEGSLQISGRTRYPMMMMMMMMMVR
ncbi:hypothetical protein PoB_000802400 [Plakobranchus ocellatus]|uniref:Uncharacterized protein n=1 Tax=Plakobranchus ocellatus TaxID=259542 RepID=A0AAV3YHN6_9GAST|nr:hypothetical protein PoB_000802400 [Plakobranchus ocellatus]